MILANRRFDREICTLSRLMMMTFITRGGEGLEDKNEDREALSKVRGKEMMLRRRTIFCKLRGGIALRPRGQAPEERFCFPQFRFSLRQNSSKELCMGRLIFGF